MGGTAHYARQRVGLRPGTVISQDPGFHAGVGGGTGTTRGEGGMHAGPVAERGDTVGYARYPQPSFAPAERCEARRTSLR